MTVATIDFEAVYAQLQADLEDERYARLAPPLVRFWDGDWNLRGAVHRIISADVRELRNETGTAQFELPLDYWMSEWVIDVDGRANDTIMCTVDKDGVRWSGRMESFTVVKNEDGTGVLRMLFKHDYEELKYITVYSNPFLPPEVQFPKVWVTFAPAAYNCKITAFFAIQRIMGGFWQIPDDPLDSDQWGTLDQSQWSIVVAPHDLASDTSPLSIVHSRFKNLHETTKKVVEDADLTWTFRRYLPGDPPPWEGANLRYGCLVLDLIDRSARHSGTSFGGDLFDGLLREFVHIDPDGLTETVELADDPNFVPPEYLDPDFLGTVPAAPWVIYRDGIHTGIQTSEFTYKPATAVRVVGGGHSMPGTNELIGATIRLIGALLAEIPGMPDLGGVAQELLEPVYSDVFLAFSNHAVPGREGRLGWSHYAETWAEGADRAYTLAWLLAVRAAKWATRQQTAHEVVVADGAPFRIGQRGLGHFYLGDRVGTTVRGMVPGKVFVDTVSEVGLAWDRENAARWSIVIGARDEKDPVVKAWERLQDILGILQDLGVL
ncbi:phage tail protein [Nocardia cyriacigeorgica]|uniref:Gp37-like protein n=1 Tax=Nocardia cyriacigeorgica TaxID=135487 RepID=UPI001893DC88|nr:phage tail protein [Nocardia cyriacigeorgica]MBF6085228.1 phage tail protein [Nocardia cyriacigeorgica]